MGDYNEILSATKKCGGLERFQNQMEGFRNVINECGFQDMGYVGPNFTWCNRRSDGERIRKVLAIAYWMELYCTSKVFHIVDSTSNHCALLLIDNKPHPTMKRDDFILRQPGSDMKNVEKSFRKCGRTILGCNLQMG